MRPITTEQLKCLNTLVSKLHLSKEDKQIMVFGFSGGRVTSSKDLIVEEATAMIKHLKSFDPNEKMRRKVFALAYEAGMIYGDTVEDKKMNAAKLNSFLLNKGAVKKSLNNMTQKELLKVVNQFQQIVIHSKETVVNKTVSAVLEELHMPVTRKRKIQIN